MALRFLIILLILGLAEFYSFILVKSMVSNLPPTLRTTLMVVYVVVTLITWVGFMMVRQLQASVTIPHMVRNIFVAFAMGLLVGKVLVLLIMFIDDARRLFTWITRLLMSGRLPEGAPVSTSIDRSMFLKTAALVLGGLTLSGFIYGISNRYRYRVRKVAMKFASLPEAFKGLRIVQISDIHTGSFDNHSAVNDGITRVMDQKPDIIFFTGDLVNNHADEVDERYQQIFSRLNAPLGVYSTLGNHDYGDYIAWPTPEDKANNLEKLKGIHASMGWKLMMNEHIVFERGGDKIAVLGIENWGAKANFPKYGDMKKAHHGLPEKNVPFKILLSHDPSHWEAQIVPEYADIDLMLSGHTHGMQFGVDSKWLKWSPVQYLYKQWAGHYQQGSQSLYVNRGFGFLGYPGRLGIMPEITVIELS